MWGALSFANYLLKAMSVEAGGEAEVSKVYEL
jgi:hypothetical protein